MSAILSPPENTALLNQTRAANRPAATHWPWQTVPPDNQNALDAAREGITSAITELKTPQTDEKLIEQ